MEKTILDEIEKNLKAHGFKDLVKYDGNGKATHYELGDAIQTYG